MPHEMRRNLNLLRSQRSHGQQRIYNFFEFSEIVGLSDATIHWLNKNKVITPSFVCGKRSFFDEQTILDFIKIREEA